MRGRGGWASCTSLEGYRPIPNRIFQRDCPATFLNMRSLRRRCYKSLREFSPMKAVSLYECRTLVLIGASLVEGGAAYATPTM